MKTWNPNSLFRLAFLTFAALAASFGLASVAFSAPTTPLSWDEVVRLAIRQNSEYQGARATVEQNDALIRSAWGNFLPTVNVNLETSRLDNDPGSTVNGAQSLTGVRENNVARLTYSQNLFNGFADKARVDQAKQNRAAAQAALDVVKASLSASLKSSFQSLLVAQRNVELASDIIARRKRNYELVSIRFDGGRENKGSVLLSKANWDQAELEKLQALNAVEAQRLRLARAIGRDDLGDFKIDGKVPVELPPGAVDIQALAMDAPELRQAMAQERAAQFAIKVAKENYLPSLDLSASIGRTGADWFPEAEQRSITLGLSFPIFNGGRDYYGAKAASAVATVASRARETALRNKIVSLREAYNAYVEAVQKEKIDQTFAEAARVRSEIGRSKYNTGLLSFEEWDIIENDLIAREKAALTSQNNRVSAEATWEQSQGRGVIP
ncbi:MAG: TolC family protein [Proteobacteria bacterium]|nr:MAG: TolC family protein [Pseudomonadota bacterium]